MFFELTNNLINKDKWREIDIDASGFKNNKIIILILIYSWNQEIKNNKGAEELAVNISKLINLTQLDLNLFR